MRKLLSIALSAILITGIASFVFAEEEQESSMMDKETMMGGMPGKEMMGGSMMRKKCMGMDKDEMMGMCLMRNKMMKKEMVATSDGGVIVMSGNKLFKYDRNLNLKKEVEIKMDMKGMHKMMKKMMKKCPTDEKMMGEETMEHEWYHPGQEKE